MAVQNGEFFMIYPLFRPLPFTLDVYTILPLCCEVWSDCHKNRGSTSRFSAPKA
jgi:hypothetical protein